MKLVVTLAALLLTSEVSQINASPTHELSLPFLPLKPPIPPSLSEENEKLLSEIEAQQPEIIRQRFASRRALWLSLLGGVLLALLAPLILFLATGKKKPPPTPEEEALKILQALSQKTYSDPAGFVTDLTTMIRNFVKRKYQLNAPHLTTEEFLEETTRHPLLSGPASERLALFLQAADQVKFAGRTPAPSEYASALNFAKAFIS